MIYFHLEVNMGNQVNIGDQNTQQVGQNPMNQNVQIPEKPKVNYWMISTMVLLILFLGGVGVLILNLKSQRTADTAQAPNLTESVTSTPTSIPVDYVSSPQLLPSPMDSANWKSFLFLCTACNGYPNYTIQYPIDWVLEEKTEGGIGSIKLVASGHTIFIQEPGVGYDRCLYSDSKPFEGPSVKFGSYIEIKTSDDGILRRPQQTSQENELTLCGQSTEGDFYTVSKYGTIKYHFTKGVDKSLLNVMDKIVGTLRLDSQR